ncbi:unnamed protein product [Calicophoron daubneyi]|uniref:DH domain-containing protein n=1 Tax=Calicophoron daubneyi TaxID=300641 RepID=A0AAV2T6K8_CALDB
MTDTEHSSSYTADTAVSNQVIPDTSPSSSDTETLQQNVTPIQTGPDKTSTATTITWENGQESENTMRRAGQHQNLDNSVGAGASIDQSTDAQPEHPLESTERLARGDEERPEETGPLGKHLSLKIDSFGHEIPDCDRNKSQSEHVFEIILEDESKPNVEGSPGDQIFYLPLTLGSSPVKSNEPERDFASLTGLKFSGASGSLLRQLGRSLSQTSDSDGANEPGKSSPKTESTPSSGDHSTASSFLSPRSTLITDSLMKGSDIPESITQQFNQIAKLNKSGLRSRRTVRTSTTKLPSALTQALNIATSTAQGTEEKKPSGSTDSQTKRLLGVGELEDGSNVNTKPHLVSSSLTPVGYPETRGPVHARFHSDETQPMTDFTFQSAKSDTEQRTQGGETSTSPVVHQPVTYVRSVTAERLPIFIRTAGVLRSKSAVSTLPTNHRGQGNLGPHEATISPSNMESSGICSPRSLPESSINSRCQSSTHTASNEGSTNSLPSLETGGSGSTGVSVTVGRATESQEVVPASYDSGLQADIQPQSTDDSGVHLRPLSLIDQKAEEGKVPRTLASVLDRHSLDVHSILLKRRHIVKELIQVEKEYVNALATLMNVYCIPLKQEKILDDQQVDAVFFKVSELQNYHMSFLNNLQMWELTNTVGDKLLDMFSREAVASCYCSFVENFPTSEKILENAWNTKSSFQKFCEQRLRTQRTKLPLKALLVQPIQRIPRYELLVKRLLEYSPDDLSDKALLIEAKSAIHRLALRVNEVQASGQDESLVEGTKLLERLLAPATLTPSRTYIRHDTVSIEDRKDPVCIFMFTDQIVFTVAKRRGSQVQKKPVFLRLQSPKGVDTIENIKYKIFHRLGIEAIEFEQYSESDGEHQVQHREIRDKKDLALLAEIENISSKLDYRHHDLDNVLRNLYQSVQQELEELRAARCSASSTPKSLCVFTATTKEGIERYELTFPTPEKQSDWEFTVLELKRQLSSVKRTSQFYKSIEIPQIVTGVQLSCAAAVEVAPVLKGTSPRDIWICASDGYTGFICVLNLTPSPVVCVNVPLAGCTSRITCICGISGYAHSRKGSGGIPSSVRARVKKESSSVTRYHSFIGRPQEESCLRREEADHNKVRSPHPSEEEQLFETANRRLNRKSMMDEDSDTVCQSVTHSNSSAFTTPPDTPKDPKDIGSEERSGENVELDGNNFELSGSNQTQTKITDDQMQGTSQDKKYESSNQPIIKAIVKSESCTELHKVQSDEDLPENEQDNETSEMSDSSDVSDVDNETQEAAASSQQSQATSKQSSGSGGQSSDHSESNLSSKSLQLIDPSLPTMWLGTEEGSILIFSALDNIKNNRYRQKISLSSSINSILQLDTRIFVACLNGDLLVYDRNSDGSWELDTPKKLSIDPDMNDPVVVRRMLAVVGNVWCAVHRFIYVLNSVTLQVELSFPLNGNPADPRGINLMAYGNQTVWLATDNSPRVSLYHAISGEFLMEIDLKPVVLQSLLHCDAVIMRHKEVCLRITCMTVCKDLLWAGTSAGVIVTVAIPRISIGSTRTSMEPPQIEVLPQGHIGQVRFLVSLENLAGRDRSSVSEKRSSLLSIPERGNISSMSSESVMKNSSTSESIDRRLNYLKTEDKPGASISVNEIGRAKSHSPTSAISRRATSPFSPSGYTREEPDKKEKTGDICSLTPPNHYGHPQHPHLGVRRASVNPCTTIATQMRVISGGDGLEEYSSGDVIPPTDMYSSIAMGDNDGKNYLLLWDVH